jgi:ketosteroid isomerase-like protein
MKTRCISLVPVVLLLAACSTPSFRSDIEAANRHLTDSFNRGDYRAVAAAYLDDAVLIGPGDYRVEGREAIDAYWIRPWQDPHWSLEVLDVEGTPDMPVQRGRSLLRTTENGKMDLSDVQFVVIWRRQPDGTYKIAVDAYWPTGQPPE